LKSLRYFVFILAIVLTACQGNIQTPIGPIMASKTPSLSTESAALPQRLQDIQKAGKLIVGTAITAPFEFRDKTSNELIGFDVDLINEIASRLKVKVEFKEIAFAELLNELSAGKVDVVIAGMYITDARKQIVDMSQAYLDTGLVMVTKNTSAISTPQDLKGKTVGVKEAATGQIWAENLRDKDGVALEVRTYKTTLESLDDLDAGKVDVVLNDKLNTLEYMKTHPTIKLAGDVLAPAGLGIAVKKGDSDLLAFIDTVLADLKTSGDIQQWFGKWISPA
jgi:ABC-type amino acid transport substrate-binding protein